MSGAMREKLLKMPGVTNKRMFGCDAYFVEGRMFAFGAYKGGFVLKLPAQEQKLALKYSGVERFRSRAGTKFGEWIRFDLNKLSRLKILADAIEPSYRYVKSLPQS